MKTGAEATTSNTGPASRRPFAFTALLWAAVGAVLGAIGYGMLWSKLPSYDDEGYILLSARMYWAQGALYDSVYSQYGPAFYVVTDALQRIIGGPLTHASARWMTLALWLGTAGACAAIVQWNTRSRSLTFFTAAGTFLYLYFLPDEPFHPGSLIIFLLSGSLYALVRLLSANRWAAAVAFAGSVGAILVLTKINVGVFYLAAMGAWAALHAQHDRHRAVIKVFVTAMLVALAAALMKTLWGQPWITTYLLVFAVAGIGLVLATPGESRLGTRHAARFIVAGIVATSVVLLLVAVRGTTLSGFLEGVLLGPTRHSANYSYAVDWRPGTLIGTGMSLVLAVAHPWICRRFSITTADRLIVALRLAQTVGLLVAIMLLMHARVIGAVFSYVAPLIWTWVIPLRGMSRPAPPIIVRSLIGFVLLLQFLHAYPIGGIQETWGTFLFIPLVALGLAEIRAWHAEQSSDESSANATWRRLTAIGTLLVVGKIGWASTTVYQTHAARLPLGLPGAEALRLPEPQRTAYRILALNAAVHADMLFSMPGMFSYNVWTDLPTPTAKNTTLWFTLLNEREQQAAILALEKAPRACIIVDPSLVTITEAANVSVRGPLRDYIFQHFAPAFRVEGSDFMVRKGRAIAPLNVAQLSVSPGPAAAAETRIRLTLHLIGDGQPVDRIEVSQMTPDPVPALTLDRHNATITVAAVDRAGRLAQEAHPGTWPLQLTGPHVIAIEFMAAPGKLPPESTVFYLKGSRGEIITEARIQ